MAKPGTKTNAGPERTAERVEKPWGHELIWAHTDRYVGKILHIRAGESLSYQFHEVKEETIFVLSGRLRIHFAPNPESEPVVRDLDEGAVFHITPHLCHRFEAPEGGADVDLLETSTPELNDVVRLDDRYGREGT